MSTSIASFGIRGAIFDLDEVLLDKRRAWAYTLEQALLSVTGRLVDPSPLAADYRYRPWRDALRILEPDDDSVTEAEGLCRKMWERSALKRITVHEGTGMALSGLLAGGIYMAAVTSVPLPLARRQAQAAGVDRFLVALEPAPRGGDHAAVGYTKLAHLLNLPVANIAYVSGESAILRAASLQGFRPFSAAWASDGPGTFPQLNQPSDLHSLRSSAGARVNH